MNERSAMKVNTDGVLLGAVMTLLPQDRRLLDVGTGTGTIALMAAQRLAEGFQVEPGMMGKMPGMIEPEQEKAQGGFRIGTIPLRKPGTLAC